MEDDLLELAASTASILDGNYVLGNVIGCGGMGVVYSATQTALGRRVAIKVPRPELATNPIVIRRFKTEARAGGRLAHRNIARVIDLGGRDGVPFLVMEYVGGVPLETLVQHGPMTTAVAMEIVTQILAALHEAHRAGIIHADIKSANVLVETLPDGARLARVIDFGLALFSDEPFVNDDRLVSGSPEYLAPEVVSGGCPTIASDIYAAGVVLYELLTGTTPFSGGSSTQILTRHLDGVVVPPSVRSPGQAIPAAVELVVMRALAKDPGARFASAAEFAALLRSSVAQTRLSRVARGTINRVFPAEAVISDSKPDIADVRSTLADAVACGNGDSIIASYLELVRLLVDDHQLAAAAGEVEHGLGLLRRSTFENATHPATWRLQLCLASLYSGLGDAPRARMTAKLGRDIAVLVSSKLGEQHANELLARLARHGGTKSPVD